MGKILMRFFKFLNKVRVIPYTIGAVAAGLSVYDLVQGIQSHRGLASAIQILWCLWVGATIGADIANVKEADDE